MTAQEPILKARGLVKRFGKVTALNSCDFDLYPGEVLAVIGDNGAGKSVMIKTLSGALQPDAGQVFLDGQEVHFNSPIDAREAGIETVYQTLAMSPALSIADNMFMGREIRAPGIMGQWLRKLDKAAPDTKVIHTVRGVGFRLANDVTDQLDISQPFGLAAVGAVAGELGRTFTLGDVEPDRLVRRLARSGPGRRSPWSCRRVQAWSDRSSRNPRTWTNGPP